MITRKTHHYFLLPANPWPLVSRLNSFSLLFSFLIMLKFRMCPNFITRVSLIVFSAFNWWLFYKKEFDFEGLNSFNLEIGLKAALILFIFSEVFFFFSFFWAYFDYYLSPGIENGFSWPSSYLVFFEPDQVPFLNTLILLASGATVTAGHYRYNQMKIENFNIFLSTTILLGVFFTLLQGIEYISSFFSIRDGRFGSVFFILTGFHGIHVIVGSIFLAITLLFSVYLKAGRKTFLSFDLACWYWHFVDLVWLFLFFFLYYINI